MSAFALAILGCDQKDLVTPDASSCVLDLDDDLGARCTSGQTWLADAPPSPRMRPGAPCIACHDISPGAPRLVVAGTIYPTLHEPTGCFGAMGAITVRIVDAAGMTLELPVGSTGNFFASVALAMPLRAEISFEGRLRTMCAAQSTGDCNACHTESGANGAPGRIVIP